MGTKVIGTVANKFVPIIATFEDSKVGMIAEMMLGHLTVLGEEIFYYGQGEEYDPFNESV